MDRISEMIVFVAEDELGNEGIVTMHAPGATMPMVMSNKASEVGTLGAAVDHARVIARSSGRTIKVLRFTQRHDVLVIEP